MVAKRLAFAEGPRNERLFHLLRRVREGDILIPRFQRPFVWTDDSRILLLDSIFRNLPIGSLIVWRTGTHELQCFDRLAGISIDTSLAHRQGEIKTYLLDGHQRLATLYSALADGLVAREGSPSLDSTSTSEELPGDERPTLLLFDLESESFLRAPAARDPLTTAVPLSILFDPYRLREFEHQQLMGHVNARTLINRLGHLVDAFKDYEIPIITLATENAAIVTETLTRINSTGTRIDRVGMLSAVTWTAGIDLKDEIDAVLARLADDGWHALEAKLVLAVIEARLDYDLMTGDDQRLREEIERNPDVFEHAAGSLRRAARFLALTGVRGPNMLPYSHQIVLLADALGRVSDPLDPATSGHLLRWFWITTYEEAFAGASSTRLRSILAQVRSIAENRSPPMPFGFREHVVPITRFDLRSARGRALMLAMAIDLMPRNGEGRAIDAPHLLAEIGTHATGLLFIDAHVAPVSQLRAPENRIICHPTEANELRRMLTTGLDDCPPEIRLSHGIGEDVVTAWRSGGASAMLRARRARLLALERARVELLGLTYAPDPAL
jgi:Protein of unknown function DUF262